MYYYRLLAASLLALSLSTRLPAQRGQASDVEIQFKAAQQKELVDGDLKGAIDKYLAVAAHAGANRALAAQSLLRAAECYQKQGDSAARGVYERVLREYPDQKNVVDLVQARLGNASRSRATDGAVALRRVWSGIDIGGTVSRDGRLLSYADWISGNLMLHDFASGTDRALTDNPPGKWPVSNDFAEESAISRDASFVAYSWYENSAKRYKLRVTSTQTRAAASTRTFSTSADVDWIAPYDWSPDGNLIAVQLQRGDRIAQIGLARVDDGTIQILKSVDWRGPSNIFFSPDGRFLAYDLPATDSTKQRDIFVLAVDASREVTAVQHPAQDRVLGWSPDGEYVLFASDRGGSNGVWAQALTDGKPRGTPRLLKENVGSFRSMGMTNDGALYLGTATGDRDVEVATIDLETGKRLAPSVRPIQSFIGTNRRAMWSPDGKAIAYSTMRDAIRNNKPQLAILSMDSGSSRLVPVPMEYFASAAWSPDGRSFALAGTDLKGRKGIFRADAQSGQLTPVFLSETPLVGSFPQWSPDGQSLFYRRGENGTTIVAERNLATNQEREIARGPFGRTAISPDGQWIATTLANRTRKSSSLVLISVKDGAQREILTVAEPRALDAVSLAWVPNGRGLVVAQRLDANSLKKDIWFVPIDGGLPRKLEIETNGLTDPFSVHPDGHRIAITSGEETNEVWALEHFLPKKAP